MEPKYNCAVCGFGTQSIYEFKAHERGHAAAKTGQQKGFTANTISFSGSSAQLANKDKLVKEGVTELAPLSPVVLETDPRLVQLPLPPAPPKRDWSRLLDDIAEFVAGTLSQSWDVVAAYMAVDTKKVDWLILSSNSRTELRLGLSEDQSTFTAQSSETNVNRPVAHRRRESLSKLPDRDTPTSQANPADRAENALQSLARLLEAKANSGIYGAHAAKVDLILKAIAAGRVYVVPFCSTMTDMHAELKILNYVRLKGLRPCFPDEDYIGVSKPCCPLCWAFLSWYNAHAETLGGTKLSFQGFHGQVYKKQYQLPVFVDDKMVDDVAHSMKSACKLHQALKAKKWWCKTCDAHHWELTPQLHSEINIRNEIGATENVTRSRSPTRELRQKFNL